MQAQQTYAIGEGLLQAIIHNLNAQPAAQSRGLLNAIEAECHAQDQARAQKAQAEQREAIRNELKDELEQKVDAVHTSAPPAQ